MFSRHLYNSEHGAIFIYATRGDNPATPEALFVADFREFCLCYLQYEIEHFVSCRKFLNVFSANK